MQPSPYYRHRSHPWHGLPAGPDPPRVLNAYIEMTPFDLMKYEIDKTTGYLTVDRPQMGSSLSPTPYGFVPQTYCGVRVGRLTDRAEGGDGDPLDICVITERLISRAELILRARVIGVLKTLDHRRADDKILAVLAKDTFWSQTHDIGDLPAPIVDRLRHYFATYKTLPGKPNQVEVLGVYGREKALEAVEAALADYREAFAPAAAETTRRQT
jgi:inorganic pyrophosphatase